MKQRYLNKRQKSVSKTEAYEVNKEKLKGKSEATEKEKWKSDMVNVCMHLNDKFLRITIRV